VRSTIVAKNVKRTEERRRRVANLTFFKIMKNVKTAKPSSPTDTAGISASNESKVDIRPMLTSAMSVAPLGDGGDISVRTAADDYRYMEGLIQPAVKKETTAS